MAQNGPNHHFGQNGLISNWILAFARPKWTKMVHFGPFWPEEVHFGPFRSANRTLAIPDFYGDIAQLSRDMLQNAYCNDSIAVSRDMGPLLERPCASQEGGSMLLRREGGF